MKNRLLMLLAIFFVILSGCSGSSSSGDGSSSGGDGSAKISFSLKDAPLVNYKAVYVTVAKVEVQKGNPTDSSEGSWITVSSPQKTYNLLDLVNGAKAVLGEYELEEGTYGQIRLLLGDTPDSGKNIHGENHPYPNYAIDDQAEVHMLKVPSGYKSGIKIVGGFTVQGNDFEILLDFDASRSVVKAGKSGQWLLKPVIKSIVVKDSGKITGYVRDANGKPVDDITVSVQKPGSSYPEVVASTETDDNGKYLIEVSSGSYTVVVSGEDFESSCEAVTINAASTVTKDFSLDSAPKGKISGSLNISGMPSEASVSVHVLMSSPCTGTADIEVGTFNIANGGEGEIDLPEGSYFLYYVNSETGTSTNLGTKTVMAGATTTFDIDL